MDSYSGMQGYDALRQTFDAAMRDGDAEEVVIEYDTPGGEVAGAFDLAEHMYECRNIKPMVAVASELAASAGYLLMSTAHELIVPRTGLLGSIGVVAAHFDYSKAMEDRGVAVTFVYAGDKKVDGNPYQPLSKRAAKDWQTEIDEIYTMFVDAVARNRGLSTKDVRDTQAGMFMGRNAVSTGLADRVNHLENEIGNALLRRDGAIRLTTSKEKPAMTTTATPASAAPTAEALTQARAEGRAEGERAGAASERTRVKAILTCEDAKERPALAAHLALETDQTPEAAAAILKASPKAEAPSGLAAAMAKLGTPGVSSVEPGASAPAAFQEPVLDASAIYNKANANYNKAVRGVR
jgi:signal peptide peptidase SppA